MRVRLIRHGQTAGNRLRRYIGVTDQPLSPEGIEAANRHAKDLTLDRVYVSPLTRARQTAAILFPNAEQTESDKQGINSIVNLAPAIAVVLSAIPLLWYDINGKAKMDEIYAALEARNVAQKKEQ